MQDFIEKRQAFWEAADAFDAEFEAQAQHCMRSENFACVTITGARQTVAEMLDEGKLTLLATLNQAQKAAWKEYMGESVKQTSPQARGVNQ